MTTKHTFLRFSGCFVSHSIVTYYRIINKSNTTGATSGAELVYPSKSTEITPGFSEVHVCSICSFLAVFPRLYCWLFVILIFCHCVVCLSSNYGFWLPFLYLQTVCRLETKANQTYYVSLRSEFCVVMSVTISA